MRIPTLSQGIAAILALPWLSCSPVSVERPDPGRSMLGSWQQVINRGEYETQVRFIFPDSTHLTLERINRQAGTGRVLDSIKKDFALTYSHTMPVLTLEYGRTSYAFQFRRHGDSLDMFSITRLSFSPMHRVFNPENRNDPLVGVWSAQDCEAGLCGIIEHEYSPTDSLFVTASRSGSTAAYRLDKRPGYYRYLRAGGVDRISYFFLKEQLYLNRIGWACQELGICDAEQMNILTRL